MIDLVKEKVANQNEYQKLLETTKKEAEESAKQAEVYFKFLNFYIEILNIGIFRTDRPIGAGEGGSSRRFEQKSGRNRGNAQGN
jgi:hypothetical protein